MNENGETVCRPSKPKTGPVVLATLHYMKMYILYICCNYGGFYSDLIFVFKYFCVSKTLLFFNKDCGALHTKIKVE